MLRDGIFQLSFSDRSYYMKDLLFFVCFILIFLFGFSITSWSLITTTSQVNWTYTDDGNLYNVTVLNSGSGLWTWQYLRDVTNYGIWKVFGQIDPIVDNNSYSDVAWVLAIIFVAVSNVLLLNVLVALFNVTIQQVQGPSVSDKSDLEGVECQSVNIQPKITDSMQRESAIAEDYWRYTLRHETKNQTEIALENLEQKLEELKNRIQQAGSGYE
ncbi:unnamed protein product [Didymodactylos carnosus]|uniref:Ion transport domain-containing protein n=1 Tax=Didymodactylos carnosus TaxID=1234261 RepID=A0A8S2EVY8_9BILA|nr:unnamed protein product [Didymodactylos carnosus]CAF4089433.1 unnamed protein product [Didymodactylos carnosus]